MDASISGTWLLQGYFDLSQQDSRHTTTQQIRNELCTALGLSKKSLSIPNFPARAKWKNTFWWREGNVDYAEAQFVAGISQTQPIRAFWFLCPRRSRDSLAGPRVIRGSNKPWPIY